MSACSQLQDGEDLRQAGLLWEADRKTQHLPSAQLLGGLGARLAWLHSPEKDGKRRLGSFGAWSWHVLQRAALFNEQSFPGTWKVKKKVFAGRRGSSKWVITERTKGG